MSETQLTIVGSEVPVHTVATRYRLDDKTCQLGKVGLANARAILAEAAQRRQAAQELQAQAA
jgi:hypothetical protein